jgi:hypothetical protein
MKRVISTICFLVVIVAVNIAIGPPANTVVDHSAVPKYRRRAYFTDFMSKVRPQIVLLGNSMLESRVDEIAFSRYTRIRTAKFWSGGSSSAWWYAVTKNIIAEAQVKPKIAVIFFRDQFLTDPEFRVDGKYKAQLNEMLSTDDELVDRLAYLKKMNWFTYALYKHSSLFQKRDAINDDFKAGVKDGFVGKLMGIEKGKTDEAIARVFANKNMDRSLLTARQLSAESRFGTDIYDFDNRVKKSFLPHIIDVAKKNDIELVFVRIKKRRDAEAVAQPVSVKKYIDDLGLYLERNDCNFLDFTYDARIKAEHFAEGDHLTPEQGKQVFTKIFADEIIELLRAKDP